VTAADATPQPTRPPATLRGGVLVIDKPSGISSHDVVAVVRRAFRGLKVGHTGTLDPFATGVLPLIIGRATRLAQFFVTVDKEYEAGIRLGRATDSYDLTGTVTFEAPPDASRPSEAHIRAALASFLGPLMQVPPAFSAKMSDGVRAYERARQGAEVALRPSAVSLDRLNVLGIVGDLVQVRLTCSSGFYVRSLAHDLGVKLGTGAHLASLRRLRSGAFGIDDALTLDAVVDRKGQELPMIGLERLLPGIPGVVLNQAGVEYVTHGRDITPAQVCDPAGAPGWPAEVRLLGPDGALLAVATAQDGPVLHPAVVLV